MVLSPSIRHLPFTVALLLAAGCGDDGRPPLAEVRGTVTLDGKPLAGAGVAFKLEGARASVGWTDDDGKYELTFLRDIRGAAIGTHKVIVSTADEETPERLPARYNSQSTLTREVKPGKNVIDFELHSGEEPESARRRTYL